jgi:hypothetical protein
MKGQYKAFAGLPSQRLRAQQPQRYALPAAVPVSKNQNKVGHTISDQ